MEPRLGSYNRSTGETQISVSVNLDGTGNSNITSGNGVLDHMINQLTRHGLIDIELEAKGDSALTGCLK